MNKLSVYSVLGTICLLYSCQQPKPEYPEARKSDQVDEYFGTPVADPYRWLEDDNSEETAAWVEAQNKVTFAFLDEIPFREQIREKLTEMWNYPKMTLPVMAGKYFFYTFNNGLQNQNVHYVKEGPGGEGKVFIDPNTLSEDGTVALTTFSPSKDGKYVGYGLSTAGSDWNEYRIRNVETGEDLADHLRWIKFSGISWLHDGFFYSRYPAPEEGDMKKGENLNNKVYYHKLGTSQAEDKLVYEDPAHPEWGFYGSLTTDKKYLVITVSESSSGNAFYFKDMASPHNPVHKVVESFDKDFTVIDHLEGNLLVMTNDNAPNYRVVKINPLDYSREQWNDFIPEKSSQVLKDVSLVGGKIFAEYEKDAHSEVEVYTTGGEYLYNIGFPAIGSVSGFDGDPGDSICYYTFTSYTYPSIIYKYNIEKNASTLYYRSETDIDPEAYETRQVFFESKDGTKVPMYIVHRKGMEMNGKNPVWMYGYGGFNSSRTPNFSIGTLFWLEQGGIYVSVNLRGGGEYGETWHQAGTRLNKQNVFDDFIWAARYLIAGKYTSPSKFVIQGGSNGGLLIGAVINQAPELFRVAFPQVGVMDMLRYHKFTIGRFWATDYGTSEESREMFEYLLGYSPLHNIRAGVKYPAVMVTTADHDDRVVPAHSFKYAATLQENYTGKNPVLIRIETKAGHGSGKPTSKRIEEAADLYSFAFYNLGITPGL